MSEEAVVSAAPKVAAPKAKKEKKRKAGPASVTVGSYPKFVFVWPLIVIGELFALLIKLGYDGNPVTQGWIFITVAMASLICIGLDLNRNSSLFVLFAIGGLWGLNYWLEVGKDFPFIGSLFEYFGTYEPAISIDTMLLLSHLLLIPYLIMIAVVYVNDRWRITQNEIEHLQLGLKEDALPRAGKRIKASYPDAIEFVFLLSGTLVVYGTNNQIIKEIKNVPLLVFRMRKIDRILESMSVTADVIASLGDDSSSPDGL